MRKKKKKRKVLPSDNNSPNRTDYPREAEPGEKKGRFCLQITTAQIGLTTQERQNQVSSFSTLKHTDPHTVRGRPTLKDGLCNERIFRNGSFREFKIARESNDLAKVSLESIKAGIFKSGNL